MLLAAMSDNPDNCKMCDIDFGQPCPVFPDQIVQWNEYADANKTLRKGSWCKMCVTLVWSYGSDESKKSALQKRLLNDVAFMSDIERRRRALQDLLRAGNKGAKNLKQLLEAGAEDSCDVAHVIRVTNVKSPHVRS